MKKLILAAALTLTAVALKAQDGLESIVNKGDVVPEFTVEMVDGSKISMSDLRGKVVLVNFWATWCPPCRAELSVIQSELIDKVGSDDFMLLTISRGEELEKVLKFREQQGYTFPMAIDPEALVFPMFAESGIPRNYLVDKQGVVRDVTIGFSPSDDPFGELVGQIRELLK